MALNVLLVKERLSRHEHLEVKVRPFKAMDDIGVVMTQFGEVVTVRLILQSS